MPKRDFLAGSAFLMVKFFLGGLSVLSSDFFWKSANLDMSNRLVLPPPLFGDSPSPPFWYLDSFEFSNFWLLRRVSGWKGSFSVDKNAEVCKWNWNEQLTSPYIQTILTFVCLSVCLSFLILVGCLVQIYIYMIYVRMSTFQIRNLSSFSVYCDFLLKWSSKKKNVNYTATKMSKWQIVTFDCK